MDSNKLLINIIELSDLSILDIKHILSDATTIQMLETLIDSLFVMLSGRCLHLTFDIPIRTKCAFLYYA